MITPGNMGLSKSCGGALMDFLSGLTFTRYSEGGTPGTFKFVNVSDEWTPPNTQLQYPAASVATPVLEEYKAFGLTPVVYEDSYNPIDGTTIVKYAEYSTQFFITVWASDPFMRDAILEAIEQAFNPRLDIGGVFLPMPSNFGLTMRATLLEAKKLDTQETVFRNELQTLLTVRIEADAVKKMQIPLMNPTIQVAVT